MLKEEPMLIKERLNKDDLSSFTTLNSWLEKFKLVQEICERRIIDKVDNIPQMTIQSWIERLSKLATGHELKKIWNMAKLGLFFNALSEKSLVQKLRSCKGGKTSKQCFTAAFFVAADGCKVLKPVVVWKRESPKCFKNIRKKSHTKYGTLFLKQHTMDAN